MIRRSVPFFSVFALAAGLGVTATALPTATLAQGADTEEVVVTGSRIRQSPLEEKAPILTLSAEEIKATGLTSVGDYLQRLSGSGGALNTKFNSSGNFGFPPDGGGIGAGAAEVDLRYLGSKRVLVLVDGIRWVNGSSASGVAAATDVNTIPVSIIERIEVLEDGASAIYGSDAIAGVVNIITKKDFEGMEVSAYAGTYDEGDGQTREYSLSLGSQGEQTRVFFNISHTEQKRINARDRDISSTPIPFVTDGTGGSSGTPQGRFFFFDPNATVVPLLTHDCTTNDGVDGPVFDPSTACGGDFNEFDTGDRFNFAQFNLLLTPSERTSVYSQAQHELTDNVSLYLKGLFNNRKSTNQAAPEPLFIGPDAGNGNLLDTISVDATNPYNPFGFTLSATPVPGFDISALDADMDEPPDGVDDPNFVFAGRRPLEGGPRIFQQDVNTWYLGGGLVGQFDWADRTFFWDVNAIWSQNRADQIKMGGYNSRRIANALGPAIDTDGDGFNETCVNDSDACVPLNFFGGQGSDGSGTITPEMLSYIAFIQKDVSEQELVDITANITGNIVDLPAGPLGFAAGFEHREQDGFFQPDAIVVAGESAGVPSSPTAGGFDSDEFYAEFNVPILADTPGADLLEASAAIRTADYSTFGSETTSKFGLRWRPVSNVLLRGSFGEGLRAPSIGELFGSVSRFDQTIDDPCSDMLGLSGTRPAQPQATVDNCVALGVPANGSYVQNNPQISVSTGGNRDLQPEEVDTISLGAVYDADWVDNVSWIDQLQVEVTYYDHDLEGAIQAIDAETQLQSCVSTLDSALCSGIGRTPNGVINSFANQLANIAGIETSGYDFSVTYVSPEYDIGRFQVNWYNTFLNEYVEILPTSTGTQEVALEGTETGDPEQAYPEWKSTVTVNWLRNDWSGALIWRFIDAVDEDCGQGAGPCIANTTNELDATNYIDVQASWAPSEGGLEGLEISAGINNLFDEDPPTCFSCALNGFDATTYDPPGLFGYIRATWRR